MFLPVLLILLIFILWIKRAPQFALSTILLTSGRPLEDATPFLGGLGWQSFALSAWEAFVGTGIIAGLFALFRQRFDHQGPLARAMSDNAYAVYVIHASVIVFFAYSLRSFTVYPIIKFLFVSVCGISLCFAIRHYLVKRLPFADKIL